MSRAVQKEKNFPNGRDPITGIIRGAEPFEFGQGKSAVLFLHGWTSTPRELRFLAEKCAAAGFYCRGILLKGHGTKLEDLSPTRYQDYYEQSETHLFELSQKYSQVFICGLSMGGLLALDLAAQHPKQISGLVLLAPFLKPWGKTFGFPNSFLIGRVPLFGNISKNIGGPIKDPTTAPDHIAYHAMPAHTMVSIIRAGRRVTHTLPQIKCPTLILHDKSDTTSDYTGSISLMNHLGTGDKTLLTYVRSNHILTLDFDREQVETQSLEWLLKHI